MNTKTQKIFTIHLSYLIFIFFIYTLKTVKFLLYLGMVHVNNSKSSISLVTNENQVHNCYSRHWPVKKSLSPLAKK